jgi:DNA-binding response OmpR family regulator
MLRVLIVSSESNKLAGLRDNLARNGLACSITLYNNGVKEALASHQPDILLFEMDEQLPDPEIWRLIQRLKQGRPLPVIVLVHGEMLESLDGHLDIDDFITNPYDARELVLRINRLLHRNGNTGSNELINIDGLVIDLAKCEVTVEGRVVELTFKEYELLKLLASNRGRVYTREALLNRVWGYDYYGGDRTVDVHVRRLRSKIEDVKHTFIETVRNIGYRFRKDA